MRAVARRGRSLVEVDLANPVPDEGQVLVRTLACGICGSDLHALHHLEHMVAMNVRSGASATIDPASDLVMGHEFCGEILEHGPGCDRRLKPGTRVVSMPFVFPATGPELVGYSTRFTGGFAERTIMTESLLLEVRNGLSDEMAAMTEPMAVGEHAVARADLDGSSVALVIGCGPVGLAVIAALRLRGVGPIVAVDYSAARRLVAERMGAHVTIDPATTSPHAHWREFDVPATLAEAGRARMAGRSVGRPVIFECVGVPGLLNTIILDGPPHAQIVVVGVCQEEDRILPSVAIGKQLRFDFVYGYSQAEFADTLDNIAEGRIDLGNIISKSVPLSQVAAAFDALRDPVDLVKIVVLPGSA